jgi:integrase
MRDDEKKLRYLYRRGPYLYFRAPGGHLTRLPPDQTTAEFRRCYAACIKSLTAKPGAAQRETAPLFAITPATVELPRDRVVELGSINAAIDCYLSSLNFTTKKPRTQYNYRKALDVMRGRIGHFLLADFDTDAVDIYSEDVTQDLSASTAENHIYLLSSIWKACKKHPRFNIKGKPNPTLEAEKRYTVKAPHQPWDDAAEMRFMESAPANLRLAKLLLHFGAQRGGDCVAMKWSDFDGRGFTVTPEKTDGRAEALPNYHLCPRPLREALLVAPREADTILVTSRGEPWANATTLSHAIRRHLIKIGLAKRGTKTLTMHGLRKNAAADVASLGLGASGVKSVTGQKTDAMANYYSEMANKRRINADVVAAWDAELDRQDTANSPTARRRKLRAVK